jgi:vacuolar protein sorting-associated protein 13A/C
MVLLGQDKDYARQRQGKMLNERPKNFVEGFGYGCKATISSLTSAAFGTVYRPVVEARRGGLRGFFYGVYQGTTGLLLKPSSGVFDLFSKSCEGVKNTLRALEKRQRRDRIRYPRPFYGQQRLIKPYSDDDALLVCCVLP